MLRKLASSLVTSLVAVAATALAQETLAVRCGIALDAATRAPRRDVTIIVRDGRIVDVGERVDVPRGAREINLRRHTCLPGLIDLHAHLLINPNTLASSGVDRSSADRALDGLRNAQTMLRAGFTTLRDPGDFDAYYSLVSIRNAIAQGKFVGPRLFVAPHTLSPTGGHGDFNAFAPDLHIQVPSKVVDGPDQIRRAIREEVKYGADWIKVMATGGVMSAGDDPNATAFTDEEMRAAVEETHRHGKKITVHAIGADGIKQAVRAGVDCVEHGILIDDEGIALMKERGTWLVPTIYVLNYVVDAGPRMGFAEESIAKGRALRAERDRRIRRAFAAGVKVAYGSDTIFPHDESAREFSEMVRLGLSPMDAILAATANAAAVLGIEREVGKLAPGMVADIIAVTDNPLDNIKTLEDVQFVLKSGEVIKDEASRT